MTEKGAVCVKKWSLVKSCNVFKELWKTLPSQNSKDDSSGIDISVWILESRFKDAEIKKMTEKGAVCAEKRSFAKSRNVFWELWKILPSRNSKYEFLGIHLIVWALDSCFKLVKIKKIIGKAAVFAEKCFLGKSCTVFLELRKTLPSPNLKYDFLGSYIILWIRDSRFKDAKNGSNTGKGAVCAEKRLFAKSRNVF